MTTEQVWGAFSAAATALALIALVLALLARRRAGRAEWLVRDLRARLDVLEARPTSDVQTVAKAEQTAYVITHLDAAGNEPPAPSHDQPVARPIDGRLFVDVVARESVVKAASWTHGLRRALSAEHRNRVRFAVRQETRRAGRDRRAETKQALREFRARERSGGRAPASDVGEDVA